MFPTFNPLTSTRSRRFSGCSVEGIDPSALALLKRYRWPGNVRELRNAIQRGSVIATGSMLSVEDLPAPVRDLAQFRSELDGQELQGKNDDAETNLRAELARFEADLIVRSLEHGIRKLSFEDAEPAD